MISITNQSTTTTISKDEGTYSWPLCSIPPSIQLIPETITPLEYQRDEEIFLSSFVEFNCDKPFFVYPKWTISNFSHDISLNSLFIETTYQDLYIPPSTLSVGRYHIKLTVSTSILSNIISSKPIFIHIVPSGISLNIIPHGLLMITHGYQQDLQLNPGKYSVDHDGYPFNANVSSIQKNEDAFRNSICF
ncbi:hypothetical protein I4U23_003660 [Adineta vaga]|nr:hypothetical protein I4U23_003660 [Adineta vaga]